MAVAELQRRRDAMTAQLDGLPFVNAAEGCSMLLDTEVLGIPPATTSRRLLEHKVAATR